MNARPHDDEGLSLVELIVYIVIAGILAGSITMIFVNTWKAEQSVASQTQATTRGQLIGSEIEKAVRNAVDVQVSTDATGSTLMVSTALSGSQHCQAFSFLGGNARMTLSSSAITTTADTWPLWQSGVIQSGSTPFFSQVGNTVSYVFSLGSSSAPVLFSGQVAQRSAQGESTCW